MARYASRRPGETSRADPTIAPRRFAYADPPYPGLAGYYRDHPDYAGEVDHAALLSRLATYDGWALSTSARALPEVDVLHHGVSPMLTLPTRVIGAKPAAFCRWMFELIGADPHDSFDDLFPGSGIVGKAWAFYATAERVASFAAAADPSCLPAGTT